MKYLIEVVCSNCKKQYLKRKYSVSAWNGLCKTCNSASNAKAIPLEVRKENAKFLNKGFHQPHSEESKQKIRQSRKGKASKESHYLWKGGIATTNRTERNNAMQGADYRNWRKAVFEKDNYTCQVCFEHAVHLHADHIIKWSDSVELRYSINNGRTLCRVCHYYITFRRQMPKGSTWGLTTIR